MTDKFWHAHLTFGGSVALCALYVYLYVQIKVCLYVVVIAQSSLAVKNGVRSIKHLRDQIQVWLHFGARIDLEWTCSLDVRLLKEKQLTIFVTGLSYKPNELRCLFYEKHGSSMTCSRASSYAFRSGDVRICVIAYIACLSNTACHKSLKHNVP